jgi:uncharacterized protein (DUF2164 family)
MIQCVSANLQARQFVESFLAQSMNSYYYPQHVRMAKHTSQQQMTSSQQTSQQSHQQSPSASPVTMQKVQSI